MSWGAGLIPAEVASYFLWPRFDADNAAALQLEERCPIACVIDRLYIRQNIIFGDDAEITYRLFVNGAPTALAVTVTTGDLDGSDLVNEVAVAQGDLLSMRAFVGEELAGSPGNVMADVRVRPT